MFERVKEWRKYIKNPLQPSNEIKVRVVVDIAESYGSIINKMENMSAKDHERIFKTFSNAIFCSWTSFYKFHFAKIGK